MKNYVIAGAIAFSSTFAVANTDVNIKKVNKVIKSVINSELTPVITKVEAKFDERSNLDSVEKLKVGATLSATAKESAWSKKPTTVDVAANFKTIHSDAASTKAQLHAAVGSKTEAVSLYAYAAQYILKGYNEAPTDPLELQYVELLKVAADTKSLDLIPAQLEKLVVILKQAAIDEGEKDAWANLINSLVVDTKIQNYKTTEVVLKTTTEVALDFFDIKLLISDLSFKISANGLSLGVAISGTEDTLKLEELLANVKAMLSSIENANAETIASLKDMVGGFIDAAEAIVKGDL